MLQCKGENQSMSLSAIKTNFGTREMRRGPGEETMVNETVFCGLKLKAEFAKDRVAGYHFFIYNSFDHPITVNGILIDKNTVAGPLPDFSIITVGGFHFFWWGSKAAVEYYPEEVRKRFSVETFQQTLTL